MPVRPGISALLPSPEALSAQLQAACPHLPPCELLIPEGISMCEAMAVSYKDEKQVKKMFQGLLVH